MIAQNLLFEFGAEKTEIHKGEIIFTEGSYPTHYYQLAEGQVKMNNFSEDGKEFIQNIFKVNQSFGEPPLFIDEPYPANAIAITAGFIIKIKRSSFYELLETNPKASFAVNKSLARRLYYKSIMAPEISAQDPEKRLLTLLDYLKNQQSKPSKEPFLVPMTRQQLADLTGLRVETVIRTFKQLEKKGHLQIINRKIYR